MVFNKEDLQEIIDCIDSLPDLIENKQKLKDLIIEKNNKLKSDGFAAVKKYFKTEKGKKKHNEASKRYYNKKKKEKQMEEYNKQLTLTFD